MPRVFVVDDDRTVFALIRRALKDRGVEILTAENAEAGLPKLRDERPDVLLLDIVMPGMSGIEAAKKVREIDAKLPVVFITSSEESEVAIEAMQVGGFDYLTKPLAPRDVRDVVDRALESRRLMHEPVRLAPDDGATKDDAMIGRSPGMIEAYKKIARVAEQDVAVLIRGASGAGKELAARAVYQHSRRSEQQFLAVNCAALSDTLLESELFGHEQGAFTGAERRRIGKFEQCDGGTIFLDEVGDMSAATQSKMLRLLQEQTFERLGGEETVHVDVRIVAATNCNLEEMIHTGRFRLDLFHRLNAFEIQLPPLSERGDDLEMLVEHFIRRFNETLEKNVQGVAESALDLLKAYEWPGNVRELQTAVRKALLTASGSVLTPECFPEEVRSPGTKVYRLDGAETGELDRMIDEQLTGESDDIYAVVNDWMQKRLLTRVLTACDGNQTQAARRLGISRSGFRKKLKELGLA